jgi:hypothetical protein
MKAHMAMAVLCGWYLQPCGGVLPLPSAQPLADHRRIRLHRTVPRQTGRAPQKAAKSPMTRQTAKVAAAQKAIAPKPKRAG